MEQQHRDVRDGARGGEVRGDGGTRRSARGRRFGGAGLAAAVAAGCAVTLLATDSSWALRRPEPRPALEVAAGTPTATTLPAPSTPEASTLPAPAKPGTGTGPGAGSGTRSGSE
ncbi:hypothetical protein ABZW03_15180, partial [Kitasatospora sp. NPDC004799]